MGAIDDTRKLLQDLITPDLKAIEARVVALEQKVDLKLDHLEKKIDYLEEKMDLKFGRLEEKMDFKFARLEEKMDLKFDALTSTMAANQATIMRYLDMDRRVEKLESDRTKALDRPS